MADRLFVCPYCKRNDFKNARGLTQHQNQNQSCKFKATAKFGEDSAGKIAHNYIQCAPLLRATLSKTNSVVATNSCQDSTLLSDNDDSSESEQNSDTSNENMDIDEDDGFLPGNDEDEHMDSDNFDKISDKLQQPGKPDTSMLNSYNDYVQYSLINNLSLNKKELPTNLIKILRASSILVAS